MGEAAPLVPLHRLIRLWLNGVLLCEAGRLRQHERCSLMESLMTETQQRTTQIKFWATPEERAALQAKAAEAGLSLRAYLLEVGLNKAMQSDRPPPRAPRSVAKRERVVARALPEERAVMEHCAAQAGLSLSAFMVAAAVGTTVKSVVDLQQVATLSQVNADQGRLGGLLKLWLSKEDRFVPGYPDRAEVTDLLDRIRRIQEALDIATRQIINSH